MDSIGCPPVVTMIGHVVPATERDERGSDDLSEVAVGNGALCHENQAFGAVDLAATTRATWAGLPVLAERRCIAPSSWGRGTRSSRCQGASRDRVTGS